MSHSQLCCARGRTHEIARSKAVADGGMSFYVDRTVSVRFSQFSYGVRTSGPFDPKDPQHQKRKEKAYTDAEGDLVLNDWYLEILGKVYYPFISSSSILASCRMFVSPKAPNSVLSYIGFVKVYRN